MPTYATCLVQGWLRRSPASFRDVVEFRNRVIAAGRAKRATRTGIIVILAKHLKSALEAAVRDNPTTPEPDLRKALDGYVDWYAIAENLMDVGLAE